MQELMTREITEGLPRLYEQDGAEDLTVYVHYFSCVNGWDWWLLEFDGTDEVFGLVEGYDDELGYFSIKEMEELNRQMGFAAVERDEHFEPKPLGAVRGGEVAPWRWTSLTPWADSANPRGAALLLKLLNFSCSRCLFLSDHSDHFLVNINKHPCSGGRDGDSHRRHAHAHGRRLARAIPATGIIIREAFGCEPRRCEGLSRQAPHRGTTMVATAPPEGLLASETEPPWALAASEAAWRPSP